MKKMAFAFLLMVFLLGAAGCRLPIVDPPVVGRWRAYDAATLPGTSLYYEFSRDKTGKLELVSDKGDVLAGAIVEDAISKQGGFVTNFTWTYKRPDHILTIKTRYTTTEYKVDYNFFRTKFTIHNVDAPNYRTDYELVSTPIFRL